jgi:hypothetical protein
VSDDSDLLDWAEAHPEAAMASLKMRWDVCGPGWRERFFGFRAAIEAAILAAPSQEEGRIS